MENLWIGSMRTSVTAEDGAILAIGLITTETLVDLSLQKVRPLV